jgi:uncharacterized protein YgiM (DUF1202 family)
MRLLAVVGFGLTLSVSAAFAAAPGSTMLVLVGGQGDGPACGSHGVIKSEEALPVYVGAGADYDQIDTLKSGAVVNICDKKGNWIGIVYGARDCGVSKPIAKRQSYLGVCKTGWVASKFVAASKE